MSESMNSTPRAMRLHIGIFGRRNAGKSSLVNALTAQQASIVSDLAGTTTDPVYKAMEVPGIGPCVFIDTAGYDDEGPMGQLRVRETEKALEKTDVAILVLDGTGSPLDAAWAEKIRSRGIPFLAVLNKADGQGGASLEQLLAGYAKDLGVMPLPVSARNKRGLPELFDALLRSIPPDWGRRSITGSLCAQGDTVLSPEGVVADEGIELAVILVGQVFLALYLQVHIQVSDAFLQPFDTFFVAAFPKKLVDLVLMHNMLQPLPHKRGHIPGLTAHLAIQDLVDVDSLL